MITNPYPASIFVMKCLLQAFSTLINVYVDLVVFTRIAGSS